jgi:hypothetical protein
MSRDECRSARNHSRYQAKKSDGVDVDGHHNLHCTVLFFQNVFAYQRTDLNSSWVQGPGSAKNIVSSTLTRVIDPSPSS